MRIPGLRRKDNVFQLRRRVPADLLKHYGKSEITITLKTQDSGIAITRGAEEYAKLEQEFARLRAGPSLREMVVRDMMAPLVDPLAVN